MAYTSVTKEAAEKKPNATQENATNGGFVDRRTSTIAGLQLQARMAQGSTQRKLDFPVQTMASTPQSLQREEDELLQGHFPVAQRADEEELLQSKSIVEGPVQLVDEATSARHDTGLPDNLKAGIESLSGISMDAVRVHYNSSQPAQLNALAYAQGTDIHVGPGHEQHLPHEAWHVVQQAQGRVQTTMQMKDGVPVNDDPALEQEADVMGAKALQQKSDGKTSEISASASSSQNQIQFVRGNAGLDNIKAQIHLGTTRAAQIATDIYNTEVGGTHDGDFTNGTTGKIVQSAEAMGYDNAYATRLANNNPFGVGDIAGETSWGDQPTGLVESFEFAQINDPHGHVVSSHQLNFENLFPDDGNATFRFNARNPALATFFASDVVTEQREWIRAQQGQVVPADLQTVTRENVQSVNGQLWRGRHPGWGPMSDPALQDFLANTDNGKSTISLLQGQGKNIIAGEVLRYDPTDLLATEFSVKLTLEDDRILPNLF